MVMEKIKSFFAIVRSRFSILPRRKKLALIAVIVVILFGVVFILGNSNGGVENNQTRIRQVSVASVAYLSSGAESLTVLGEVRSAQEADIRSVVQGRVTSLRKEVGDRVSAGEIIAEIENDAQLASLIQAEGAFEAAEANLNKALGGTREEQLAILETKVKNSEDSLSGTKVATVNTLKDSFGKVDEIVRSKIDLFIDNPESIRPHIKFIPNSSQTSIDLEFGRIVIRELLMDWEQEVAILTNESDLDGALTSSAKNIESLRTYVNLAAGAVQSLTPNSSLSQATIDTWRSAVNSSRTTLATLAASVSTQQDSLNSTRASYDIAQQELKQGVAGDRSEDVAAVEASLKQARGSLLSARAAYNNTIIRSPISGTINTLSISQGDFISALSRVATVANNNALEVRAFITGDDLVNVSVGDRAIVDGTFEGVVTNIGAGLDPDTKKIELRIGLTDTNAPLVHGDSVSVVLERGNVQSQNEEALSVPISALRIGADSTVVFSIKEDGTIMSHEVETGAIIGNRITITDGVTPELVIVVDARGLREGDTVSISTK